MSFLTLTLQNLGILEITLNFKAIFMQNNRIKEILGHNDRKGERAIAILQALMAFTIFLLHIISASKNQWETISAVTISIASMILMTSLLRVRASYAVQFSNLYSHTLTVFDGMLIFGLMLSYNLAYNLPLEATFKTPTVIFLGLYTVVRVLRSDPWSILVAGITVLTGWLGIFTIAMLKGANITNSYAEYISSDKLLVGAVFELAAGYAAVVFILAIYTKSARQFVANTAHIEDLAIANLKAEENIQIFEELLQSSVDGVVIVDSNGRIERINPAIENLFDYQASDLVGENVSVLMSDENAQLLKYAIKQYFETDESHLVGHSFESIGVKKSGTEFDIELSISEFNASGKVCFAGFIKDASQRTQALANEKRAKAQFENAMNAAMDAIIIIDDEGKIRNFNPAAEEIFGHKFEEISGKKLSDVIIPYRYREAHDKGMKHYLNTGEGPVLDSRIEIEGLHASGEEIQIELAIREIEGASGKLFIGYARDISERKSFEAELLGAKNSAEMATRAKTSFLAMMSHEIRTPLNGVLGIHGLLKETKLDDDQKQLLETASESGQSLLSIINDLLDFSKLEAGKFEIEKKQFDIRELVTSVINLIQPHADDKQLKLNYKIDDAIPQLLMGDAARIRQILLNLAWNAIKFTNQGKVEILIENRTSDVISFSVKDTGIGIPQEKHDELFSEFSTIDASYSNKFGGTGLGLAICKALVENMDGEIGLSSNPGKGSKFWFNLAFDVCEENESLEQAKENNELPISDLSEVRVLIAEDNKTNQLITSRYLKHFGCQFELANNGLEAVEKVIMTDFDIVLMDISMPELNGYEATAKIRKIENEKKSTLPIIAFTAYASKEDQEKISEADMDGFIPKPFSREQLAKVILDNLNLGVNKTAQQKTVPATKVTEFDITVLDTILEDMEPDSVTKIFNEFNNDVQRYLSNANEGLEQKNSELLERASHGIQGVSGMFGALQLSELANRVNQICHSDDHEKLYEEATELIKKTQDIIQATRNVEDYYLEKTSGTN